MNIFILTLGSRGDVQPYVALGRGLQAAGHTVTVCTSSTFESFITEHGLRYGYMNDALMKLLDTAEGRDAIENSSGTLGLISTYVKLMRESQSLNKGLMVDSWQSAQEARPDLVIYHPKALGGVHIAEKLGVPVILAMPVPVTVPTADFPAVGVPLLNLGGGYNRMSYGLINFGYRSYAGIVNEFRQEQLGLPAFPRSSGILQTASGDPIPVLHGFSEHVVPRPTDWPAHVHVTGYWLLDSDAGWQPPAELRAFLEAGPPPVYVGFGSMAGRNPQRLASIVVEALAQADLRGIIASGWGGLSADDLPDTILSLESAPHDWLFPQMAAVVHHGGAGTTAAGLRAGKPTIVVPFLGDQPFWGARVHALGVGSKPIPQKRLTVETLTAALREVTTDPAIQANAATLGEQIRAEDGVAQAIAAIERLTVSP